MKNVKNIFIALFMILSFNTFAQKVEFNYFNDSFTKYFVTETTNEWAKKTDKPLLIMQTEEKKYYDNYWHSSITIIKPNEIVEYLKHTKELFIERDSINKKEHNTKSYSYQLDEMNCLKGHKIQMSDNITSKYTYGVKMSSTYLYSYIDENINKSFVIISFINTSVNDRWISDVSLDFSLEQLDEFINLLETLK